MSASLSGRSVIWSASSAMPTAPTRRGCGGGFDECVRERTKWSAKPTDRLLFQFAHAGTLVHRGGFEPPRPTRGDRVTAGPFRPGSRTCASLAEGRRIERPSLITTLWFSRPVAGPFGSTFRVAESTGVEPVSLLREPLFSKQVPYRPAHPPLNCQRTTKFW